MTFFGIISVINRANLFYLIFCKALFTIMKYVQVHDHKNIINLYITLLPQMLFLKKMHLRVVSNSNI